MNAPPASRIPHRVGRRSLVHLVEHRKLRADATPPEQRSDQSPPYVLRAGRDESEVHPMGTMRGAVAAEIIP